jgi:hypothetical protein
MTERLRRRSFATVVSEKSKTAAARQEPRPKYGASLGQPNVEIIGDLTGFVVTIIVSLATQPRPGTAQVRPTFGVRTWKVCLL